MQLPIEWHNETRKLSELSDHPSNPRIADKRGVEALRKSIQRNGFIDPLSINTNGRILSGHRRKDQLLKFGFEEVDVRVPDRELTEEEERAVLIESNKAIAGTFDFEMLANSFELPELMEFGFTEFDLGIHGEVGGVSYDESVTDGLSMLAVFKVKVPIIDSDNFEQSLDEILRRFPKAVKEKSL